MVVSYKSVFAVTFLWMIEWISYSNSAIHVIQTKKQMNSLYKADAEVKRYTVNDIFPTNNSDQTIGLLFLLGKALISKNHEFQQAKNSKLNTAAAYLEVSNKAHDDTLDTAINITMVLKASNKKDTNSHKVVTHVHDLSTFEAQAPSVQQNENQDGEKPNAFDKLVVARHNFYRRKHGVPPLTYSAKISKVSQDWANYLAENDVFEHRPNNQYGENIYAASGSDPNFKLDGNKAVDTWYAEIKNYSFDKETTAKSGTITKIGHFTQLIWKGSRELGIGLAQSKKTEVWYAVCNYDPRGNYYGRFLKNVPRAK